MANLPTSSALATAESDASNAGTSLTPFETGVIDIFVRAADVLGIPKSVGEIYGLLFATPRPLAFQDIVSRLRISNGSVSQGLRALRAVGAVKLVYEPGNRRDHFLPETELRKLLSGFLRERVRPHLESGQARIEALDAMSREPGFGTGNVHQALVLRRRIEKLQSWHQKGRAVVPIVSKIFG